MKDWKQRVTDFLLPFEQCVVDLKKNVLRIGTTGTETPFLPESDLPECARLSGGTADEDSSAEMIKQSIQEAEDRELAQALAHSVHEEHKHKPISLPSASNPSRSANQPSTSDATDREVLPPWCHSPFLYVAR